jgi:predicted negative regulator of RcsB-dependent stress response
VDDLLTEREQLDQLRQWWRENWWVLIGGAAVAGLGVLGYRQYFEYKDHQSEGAAALYESIKEAASSTDPSQAAALLEQLRAEYPNHAYTEQAALLVARAELVSAPDRAAAALRQTMNEAKDPELAMIARLRLARVLAYREQYQDALALLDVPDPGQFAGRINEIKGDIYVALGRPDDARAAYVSAMVSPGAEVLDRNYLQMKLNDLPAPTGETAAAEAPAASESLAAPAEASGASEPPAAPIETPSAGEPPAAPVEAPAATAPPGAGE